MLTRATGRKRINLDEVHHACPKYACLRERNRVVYAETTQRRKQRDQDTASTYAASGSESRSKKGLQYYSCVFKGSN